MPYATRRSYAGAAPACTLTNSITSSDTSAFLTGDVTNWATTTGGPFYMVIDPGLVTEEKVLVGSRSGSTLSSITRGVDGTSAAAHSAGATCYLVFTATDADQANAVAAALTTKGDLLVTTGSALNRLGVGTDAQFLVADSAATNGVKWSSELSGSTSTDLLRITQTGTGNALVVEDSANPDATPFVIDASGRVVVGSTTATTTRIGANTITAPFQILGTTNATASSLFARYSNDVTGPNIFLAKSRSASVGGFTTTAAADQLGVISFAGSDGTQMVEAARITTLVEGTVSTGVVPAIITFQTASSAGTLTERMRIDSAGQVGIGATPTAGRSLTIGRSLTGSTTSIGVLYTGTVASDATTAAIAFRSSLNTAAESFTVTNLIHFDAPGLATPGAGSTITNQTGFRVTSSFTSATNNFGFYGDIAAATGRWNLYMNGTAGNYLAGRLGVGATLTSGAMAQITNTTAADKAFVVKGAASQSGTLLEIQNSAGTALMTVDSNGNFIIGSVPASPLTFEATGTSSTTYSPNVLNARFTGTASATSGNAGSGISFRGYTTGTTTFADLAFISGIKENTTDTNYAGALIFGTRTNGSGGGNFERMRIDSAGNLLVGMTTIATSSAKTIHLANATVPTADPTGGGVLYVESGALKYRGSSGTVTTLGNA